MAKLRINGDSSGYVDLEAPNAASSSTLDLDQVPQKNATTTGFTGNMGIGTNSPLSSPAGAFAWANPIATIEGSRPTLYLNGSGSLATIRMWPSGTDGSSTTLDDFHINAIATSGSTPGSLTFAAQGGAIGAGLSINSNNIVTTPDQPGFQFWNNGSDFAISAGGKVTCFYAGDHNIGSHFDASNQRFTAPVSGYYLFGGHLRIGAPGKIRVARFQIYLNGSRLRDLMSVGGTNDYDGSTGYDHPGASGTAVQYLTAGDYVEMYVDAELSSSNTVYIQGGSNSNRKSYWFGHLLG